MPTIPASLNQRLKIVEWGVSFGQGVQVNLLAGATMSFTHRTLKMGREVHIGLGTVGCTLEEFKTLFPDYSLPEPFIDQEYQPGYRHSRRDADGVVTFLAVPWEEGDKYLAHADDVYKVVESRRHGENWKASLAPAEVERRLLLAKEAERRIKG